MLDKDFWESRYQTHNTRWDIKQVSPPLKHIIDSLSDPTLSILIPGCGNAHEASYLLQQGFQNVTLLDIAPSPIQRLREKFGDEKINIVEEDFFNHQEQYDLILEQTFFCALHPRLRKDYVQKCHELLSPGGSVRGVLFQIDFENEGPPFGGSGSEYLQLFSPLFQLKEMMVCPYSIEPRMGNELLIHFIKQPK